MPAILDKLMRAGEGKTLKRLARIADQVNVIEEDFVSLTDAELREETDAFKARLADGESLDDLLPEAFAAVREAAKRTLGQRHYDVQIMGGAALHLGNIAEMKTGEGKTLVSTLPAYLNALAGKGVHIVTVNDYLAERDAEWMGRVHRFLGLETGVILSRMRPAERREQYACDITYGTNNEFGFDYLRDNMAWTQEDLVQRGHFYGIVDEVDSILIDEAQNTADHQWTGRPELEVVRRLRSDGHSTATGRALRGGREEAHDRRPRGRCREGRGLSRHRQPLRVGQHTADRVPQQRDPSQGAVQARQGLRRDGTARC